VRSEKAPAVQLEFGQTQPAEDGGDVGAVFDAVIDDLNEQRARLVFKGMTVIFLMYDLQRRGALHRVEHGLRHLRGKGGDVCQRRPVLPLERRLRADTG